MSNVSNTYSRRQLLKYAGVGGVAAMAGCTTDSGNRNGGGNGNVPVIGLTNEPQGFNPLVVSDSAAWAIMDQFYAYPTARDPDATDSTRPFLFRDWEFDPDTLEGSARVVEGLEWSDGEPFTTADVAFTYNYLLENEGHRYEANTANVEEITAPSDTKVEFTLANEVAAVFTPETGVFAVPILPEHVWSDVDDYQQYSPDELVGVSGWEWGDANPGNWYEINAIPDSLPDEIHEGPFVDSLRFLVVGDETSLANALKNGEVDLTYDTITPNRAFQLEEENDVTVWDSDARGYAYIALNLRRVPFDDKPFRHALSMSYPYHHLVNNLRKGLSTPGDYAAAAVYDAWRPDDFSTPMEHGPYRAEDGKLDVEAVRSYLTEADGEHEYTFGPVESSQVTGDREIRIDGQPLTEAHTNNDGEGGQGPLSVIVMPPNDAPVEARSTAKFVDQLNEVGIPAETESMAKNTQTTVVQGQENFDMWASRWIWMPKPHFYLGFWLESSRADVESETESVSLNPMGYSGADDLIAEAQNTYDPAAQKEASKKALARIYEDMPVIVTEYANRLHATSNAYDGWVKMPGGISQNPWTYLNLRRK